MLHEYACPGRVCDRAWLSKCTFMQNLMPAFRNSWHAPFEKYIMIFHGFMATQSRREQFHHALLLVAGTKAAGDFGD